MAADSNSLVCEMGELDSLPPNPVHEITPTSYSLLDMELTGVIEVVKPLTPENVMGPNSHQDEGPQELGCTGVLKHEIFLTRHITIKQKPYRVSPAKLQLITEQIEEMLDKDIIEPSTSPYAASVVLVPKKNNPKL